MESNVCIDYVICKYVLELFAVSYWLCRYYR